MTVEKELIGMLACPKCQGSLAAEGNWLICVPCAVRYPVRDGIPVLIVEETEELR